MEKLEREREKDWFIKITLLLIPCLLNGGCLYQNIKGHQFVTLNFSVLVWFGFFFLMPVFIDFSRDFVSWSSSPPKILCPYSKLSAWKPDSCVSSAVPDCPKICVGKVPQ